MPELFSDLADLFPGFAAHWIDTSIGKMFARSGGSGPPLLLLHGYTQTNVMWHRVAPVLAQRFALVIPDLPGYGWSAVPRADASHAPYDKRSMAKVMIEVMEQLGHVRFRLAGHDRGGRVAYRLALDHPGRIERMATLDIVPTYDMWHGMDRNMAMKVWHWPFLAQPAPLPEMLIEKAPVEYLEWKLASWTKAKNLSAFDRSALDHYRAAFSDPLHIHAQCEETTAPGAAPILSMTRPTARPATRSAARYWRCGAALESPMRPAGRSRSGSNGRRRPPASRLTPAISSPRKTPTPPLRRWLISSVLNDCHSGAARKGRARNPGPWIPGSPLRGAPE
jgi:haloacetate dehalogenase